VSCPAVANTTLTTSSAADISELLDDAPAATGTASGGGTSRAMGAECSAHRPADIRPGRTAAPDPWGISCKPPLRRSPSL
jgi:hypothetical protein